MEQVHSLTPAVLLLLLGVLAIVVSRPLRVSPIVGYLVAGVLIGPYAFHLVPEGPTTHLLAELGVVFLLFDIGLHFSLASIWEARRDILGLGPLQIIVCGAGFSGIAMAFGLAPTYAVLLGGALALSSTAVVIQTIAERGQQNCPVGLTATAVLIFQDIFAIFLLVLAASLEGGAGSASEPGVGAEIGLAILKGALAFVVAVVLGRYAIRPLFALLSRTRNTEVFTGMALLIVLATALATGVVGLSLTLGAFLGGMMISETPYRHVIQTEAKPFRNLLLAFFFITVGMSLDWRIVMERWSDVLVFVTLLVAVKVILVAGAARAFGWSRPGSVQLSFLLAQGSEFVFVIIAMPSAREAIGEQAVGVILTGVAVSLALTPTLAAFGNALARKLRRRSAATAATKREGTPAATRAPVVVFGMGDVGRAVADALEAHAVAYEAIEMDHDRFLAAGADGYRVAFGDLGDVRMMETFATGERASIVITIVRYDLSRALMPIMQDRYPNLIRFVAVDSDEDEVRFREIGMRPIVNRSHPRGLETAAAVLRAQGIDEESIEAWMRRQQERALDRSGDATARIEAA